MVAISAGDRLTFSTAGKLEKTTGFRVDAGDGTGTTTGTFGFAEVIVAIALEATSADGTSRVYVLPNWS